MEHALEKSQDDNHQISIVICQILDGFPKWMPA